MFLSQWGGNIAGKDQNARLNDVVPCKRLLRESHYSILNKPTHLCYYINGWHLYLYGYVEAKKCWIMPRPTKNTQKIITNIESHLSKTCYSFYAKRQFLNIFLRWLIIGKSQKVQRTFVNWLICLTSFLQSEN